METSAYQTLFLQEMRENCAGLMRLLVELEKRPEDDAMLAEVMRLSHSCKGMCATMGYEKTAELCHAMEDVIDGGRKKTVAITSDLIDLCLKAVDGIGTSLRKIEKETKEVDDYPVTDLLRKSASGSSQAAVPAQSPAPTNDEPDAESSDRDLQIRINSQKLDALLETAGELSVLRLQFQSFFDKSEPSPELLAMQDRFRKLSEELSYLVTQARLLRLDEAFYRFPRLVRDLARTQRKIVSFSMTGTDLELDKTLVDHLMTPLIHLLRNAVDHGIEAPDARRAAGKPEEGTITLSVQRNGGYALIAVEDDGAPITVESVSKIARKKNVPESEIAALTQENLLDFLCSSHFSSADAVSMVSGRGVALSSVRALVESVGGHLSLETATQSKKFVLSLPLQLSVVRAILVKVGPSTYGIPFLHINRLLQVDPKDVRTSLGEPCIVSEGIDVPLLSLPQFFKTASGIDTSRPLSVLIVEHAHGKVGLSVDEVLQNEEILVKPASSALRTLQCFSGSAILGDGSVALVLDIPRLLAVYSRTLAQQ